MGSDASYNEQALLWKAVRLVWAVTGMRRTPRRRRELHAGWPARMRGARQAEPACNRTCRMRGVRQAEPACNRTCRPNVRRAAVSMGSGTFYNEQALLWKVIRFVWAVTGMRANQFAFMRTCRPNVRRARFLWEAMRPIMSKRSYGKRCALCGL